MLLTVCYTTEGPDSVQYESNGLLGSEKQMEHTVARDDNLSDDDGDGVVNAEDSCPGTDPGRSVDSNGCATNQQDSDGDGWADSDDAFPMDPSQWEDADGDGYGDFYNGTTPDGCPSIYGSSFSDQFGCRDVDGDGWSDMNDAFPNDGSEWSDFDQDGCGDNSDAFTNDSTECVDSDNDGFGDNSDSFPMDAFEWFDSDGDGLGNNADAFPYDPNERVDSDEDGTGDNSDVFPTNPQQWSDSDGDGYGDNNVTGGDDCPMQAGTSISDRLGCPDSDSDGVSNSADAFPNDPDRVEGDLGSQVVYVFTGDASPLQYAGIVLSGLGLLITLSLKFKNAAQGRSSDRKMKSLLGMVDQAKSPTELANVGNVVDNEFLSRNITGEQNAFLKRKIGEANLVFTTITSTQQTVNQHVTKNISYTIQDSVVTGSDDLVSSIGPDSSLTGVVGAGFEWLEYGGQHYYRPENQPNTAWQLWEEGSS